MKKRLLILSFSDIGMDARVLKQVRAFSDEYRVTTCGFGSSPDPRVDHLRVPGRDRLLGKVRPYINAVLLRLRLYGALYWSDPNVRVARRLLRGRRFDVVIANDIDTVPLAVESIDQGRVHADLHEYFPGLHDDSVAWTRLRKPYFEWLIRRYATRVASATTVGTGIAEAYRTNYELACAVVTNASPRKQLRPRPVGDPIRLVHSGVAQPGRQLEITMRAVASSRTNVTLDLYLMPSDEVYLAQLAQLAERLGPRIQLLDPLDQHDLIPALNAYDVGVFVLPPTTFNNANALPNKFFDFVQARLGIIVGPSPEMVRILNEYGLGRVTEGFDERSLTTVIDALTASEITGWKAHSNAAAEELSAEHQMGAWSTAVAAILANEDRNG